MTGRICCFVSPRKEYLINKDAGTLGRRDAEIEFPVSPRPIVSQSQSPHVSVSLGLRVPLSYLCC